MRLVLLFTPLLWMLLPVFTLNQNNSSFTFTLQGLIIGFVKGELQFNAVLNDRLYLLPLLTMVFIIIFSLAVIISSLFSCGKKSLVRNIIFSVVNLAVLSVMTYLCMSSGLKIGTGLYIVFAEYIITFAMHYICNTKIKSRIEEN